jgi:hypothetical protein
MLVAGMDIDIGHTSYGEPVELCFQAWSWDRGWKGFRCSNVGADRRVLGGTGAGRVAQTGNALFAGNWKLEICRSCKLILTIHHLLSSGQHSR